VTTVEAHELIARTANGHWHRVLVIGDRRLTDERCNLDDADVDLELDGIGPDDGDAVDLCARCFPS